MLPLNRFSRWVRNLYRKLAYMPRKPLRRQQQPAHPLGVEQLEDRTLMSVTVTTGTNSISILGDDTASSGNHLYLKQIGQTLWYNQDGSSTFTSTNYTMPTGASITVDQFAAVDVVGSISTQGGNLTIHTLNGVTIDNAPLLTFTTVPTGTLAGNGDTLTLSSGNTGASTLTASLTGPNALTEGELLTYSGTSLTNGQQYALHIVDASNPSAVQLQLYQPIVVSTSNTGGAAGGIDLKASRDLIPFAALVSDPAPAITVGSYDQLQAKGQTAAQDGTISATASDTITDTGVLLFDSFYGFASGDYTGSITVGTGALVNGGTVNMTASAGDVSALGTTDPNQTASLSWLEGIFNDVTALPLSVTIKSATARVELSSDATIDSSGSVTLASNSTPASTGEAIYSWPGIMNVAISIAVDEATLNAQSLVDSGATIDATGSVSVTATSKTTTTSTARVTQNTGSYATNPNNIQISFGVNKLDVTTYAIVAQGRHDHLDRRQRGGNSDGQRQGQRHRPDRFLSRRHGRHHGRHRARYRRREGLHRRHRHRRRPECRQLRKPSTPSSTSISPPAASSSAATPVTPPARP